jgi:hypothetical protein
MEVYLKHEKSAVSVIPVYYFNDKCKFDGKFKLTTPDVNASGIDCISKGFLAVVKSEDNKYRALRKNGELCFVTSKESDDLRVTKPEKVFHSVSIHPFKILRTLFVEYLLRPKTLEPRFMHLFEPYFKAMTPGLALGPHKKVEKEEEEEEEELAESLPLLMYYQTITNTHSASLNSSPTSGSSVKRRGPHIT